MTEQDKKGRAYYYRMRTPERRLRTHATAAAIFAGVSVAGLISVMIYAVFFRTAPTFDEQPLPVAERPAPSPDIAEAPAPTAVPVTLPQPTGNTGLGTISDCDTCPDVVVIEPGRFVMGLRREDFERENVPTMHAPTELPLHGVTIANPFGLGRTEVTRAQFAAFVDDTGYNPSGCTVQDQETGQWREDPARNWRNPGFQQTDNDPVVCVSWDDANQYVQWLSTITDNNYRLPTETEWEYAARAGTNESRYWGTDRDRSCEYANVAGAELKEAQSWRNALALFGCADNHVHTAPAGSFNPNSFALYDMLGNVREWVEDCWNTNYRGAPINGSAWSNGDCSRRVLRGGSWDDPATNIRAARRFHQNLQTRRADQGFRVARDVNIVGN